MLSNWGYYCLATLVFCGITVNCLPGSAVIVSSSELHRTRRMSNSTVYTASNRRGIRNCNSKKTI